MDTPTGDLPPIVPDTFSRLGLFPGQDSERFLSIT